jgi:hypothetical protein
MQSHTVKEENFTSLLPHLIATFPVPEVKALTFFFVAPVTIIAVKVT